MSATRLSRRALGLSFAALLLASLALGVYAAPDGLGEPSPAVFQPAAIAFHTASGTPLVMSSSDSTVYTVDPASGAIEALVRLERPSRGYDLCVVDLEGTSHLVTLSARTGDRAQSFLDVFRLEQRDGRLTAETTSRRVLNFQVPRVLSCNADGGVALFTAGGQQLQLATLEDGEISTPSYAGRLSRKVEDVIDLALTDGGTVVYTRWRPRSLRGIYSASLESGEVVRLVEDGLGDPASVTATADGGVLVTDLTHRTLLRVDQGGQVVRIEPDPAVVEPVDAVEGRDGTYWLIDGFHPDVFQLDADGRLLQRLSPMS